MYSNFNIKTNILDWPDAGSGQTFLIISICRRGLTFLVSLTNVCHQIYRRYLSSFDIPVQGARSSVSPLCQGKLLHHPHSATTRLCCIKLSTLDSVSCSIPNPPHLLSPSSSSIKASSTFRSPQYYIYCYLTSIFGALTQGAIKQTTCRATRLWCRVPTLINKSLLGVLAVFSFFFLSYVDIHIHPYLTSFVYIVLLLFIQIGRTL